MTRARDIANFGDGIATADIGDGQITTAKIADGDVTSAKLFSGFANGITMAEQWRLTADLTGDADPISSNLEIPDTYSPGTIGTGMSESGGIFTFPSTGIYLITANVVQQVISTADYVRMIIHITTDNSSYSSAGVAYASSANTGTAFNAGEAKFIFDVTDTSTHKVRFRVIQANTGNKIIGSTSENYTHFTFIRLGDT